MSASGTACLPRSVLPCADEAASLFIGHAGSRRECGCPVSLAARAGLSVCPHRPRRGLPGNTQLFNPPRVSLPGLAGMTRRPIWPLRPGLPVRRLCRTPPPGGRDAACLSDLPAGIDRASSLAPAPRGHKLWWGPPFWPRNRAISFPISRNEAGTKGESGAGVAAGATELALAARAVRVSLPCHRGPVRANLPVNESGNYPEPPTYRERVDTRHEI